MAIFTLIAAATHLISWGAAALSLAATAFSVAYQQHRANKLKAEMDKRKQVNVAIDGEPFYLPVVYGRALVSGGKTRHKLKDSFVYAATPAANKKLTYNMSSNKSGSKNEYLFVQQAICYGGINNVVDVIVDEKNWDDLTLQFGQDISIYYNGGVADPIATANGIPSTNRFTNVAYASHVFRLNREEYNYNGSPNVSFFVEGNKVYDITFSGGVYSLSASKTFTTNPARILLDYLTNTVYGKGLALSSIDLSSFYKAKLICDRVVRSSVAIDGRVNGRRPDVENEDGSVTTQPAVAPRSIKLYECNVVLDTERPFRENIELILESMSEADLIWSGGTYKLSLEAPTTSVEQAALVKVALTESDIVRGKMELAWPDSSSRYAQVTARFRSEFENFVDDSVTWPTSFSAAYNTYLSEDSNILLKTEVYLPCTSDPYHALAKAEQMVRFSRRSMTARFTVGKAGLLLEPGDIISVTDATSNLSAEIMKVQSVKLSSELTAEIEAIQYDYTTFAWNVADTLAYSNKLAYYYNIVPPNTVRFSSAVNTLYGVSSGLLTWTYPNDVSVSEFVVEASADNGTTWYVLGTSLSTQFDITGLNTGVYKFSVKSKTPGGKYSTRVLAKDLATGLLESFTIQRATSDQIVVVYADTADFSTNTQSYSLGSNQYVAYYVYSGNTPSLPIRSGISFSKFVGQQGIQGVAGISGNTVAQLQIYRRSATAPATPSGGSFNFDTGVITPPSSWFSTPPTGVDPLYSTVAIASIVGTTGSDTTLAWSNPGLVVQNGSAGKSVYTAIVFKRAASVPTAPSDGSFNFSTNTLTPPTGWFLDVPSGTDPVYGTRFVFSIVGDSGSQNASAWSTPFKLAENGLQGVDGAPGADGYSTYQATIYLRSATAPATPTGGSYNFSTQALTPPANWFITPPAGTNPVYSTSTLATIQGTTGTDSTLTWSTPVLLVQNGATGANGVDAWPATGNAVTGYNDLQSNAAALDTNLEYRLISSGVTSTNNLLTTTVLHIGYANSNDLVQKKLDSIVANDYVTLSVTSGANSHKVAYQITSVVKRSNYTFNAIAAQYYYEFSVTVVKTDSASTALDYTTGGTSVTFDFSRASGTRGAGWWRYNALADDLSALTQTNIDNYWLLLHTPDIEPVKDDRFIIATTHTSGTKAFIYDGVDWITQSAFVDGNLLVAGTVTTAALAADSVTADKINVTELSAISGTLGTFQSAAAGERVVIQTDTIRVYDANNILRVVIGDLT